MMKNFKNGAGREYWVCGTEPGHQEQRVGEETSGTTLRTTRCHIPEDDTLQNHRCENLKSYNKRY
jgi:hypothetical protein